MLSIAQQLNFKHKLKKLKMSEPSINTLSQTQVFDNDLTDVACLCHAGLAQDSPHNEQHYLLAVLNIIFGYLSSAQRTEIEEYLNEKKYYTHNEIIIETH